MHIYTIKITDLLVFDRQLAISLRFYLLMGPGSTLLVLLCSHKDRNKHTRFFRQIYKAMATDGSAFTISVIVNKDESEQHLVSISTLALNGRSLPLIISCFHTCLSHLCLLLQSLRPVAIYSSGIIVKSIYDVPVTHHQHLIIIKCQKDNK